MPTVFLYSSLIYARRTPLMPGGRCNFKMLLARPVIIRFTLTFPTIPEYFKMSWLINPKKRGFNLFCCLVGGGLCIVFLSFFSENANHRSNGFIRLAPPHVAMPTNIKDITYN